MGNQHRFERRIPTHSSTSQIQKISQKSLSRQSLPIQGSSIWTSYSSIHLHKNSKISSSLCPQPQSRFSPLSGRLVKSSRIHTQLYPRNKTPTSPHYKTWMDSKLREVVTDTQTNLLIHRNDLQPEIGPGLSPRRQITEDLSGHSSDSSQERCHSSFMASPHWPASVCRETSSFWQNSHERDPVAISKPMEEVQRQSEGMGQDNSIIHPTHDLVTDTQNTLKGVPIGLFHPQVSLYSDASLKAWGAYLD